MIEWNKVTWYSRLLAIILFIAIIPTWTFYLGTQYENTRQIVNEQYNYVPHYSKSTRQTNSSQLASSTIDTTQWQTYTNKALGFSLKYPDTFGLLPEGAEGFTIVGNYPSNDNLQVDVVHSTSLNNDPNCIVTKTTLGPNKIMAEKRVCGISDETVTGYIVTLDDHTYLVLNISIAANSVHTETSDFYFSQIADTLVVTAP